MRRLITPASRQTTRRSSHAHLSRRHVLLGGAAALFGGSLAQADPGLRVVSIGGGITEIVYALGAQNLLVGVDTTSTFPAAVSRLPSVGYARLLSAEGILALTPSLVLATAEAGPPAVLQQLRGSGIALQILNADHNFEGLITNIQAVGKAIGHLDAAQSLAAKTTCEWNQVQREVAAAEQHPRVLFLMGFDTARMMVAGQGTAAQAMLDYAGAHNAVRGYSGYRPLTPESLIAARPEVLLTTRQALEAGGVAGLLRQPGMAQTPAGKAQRVVTLDTMFLLGFGPRLPLAVQTLHRDLLASLSS
ncbi:MAG: ABC transporter substrate-binding protein [Thiomonas sp.]|uniref:heme/hemin ABC transporter substrate-binding protein n=1 Tax=Thiomonas sp. TaxID=2047785 RepID=UPI002A360E85|nr:ABC transporter substrate-binding protein [Thiomonas sp.]MDY0329486.1 ABC transporter substrate-binding protein [Thiomonas sp.]